MASRKPWRMLAPLATVLVIALLWSVYWTIASAMIKDAYGEAERELSSKGISLTCREAAWGGFPFRIERNCSAPELSIANAGKVYEGSAAQLLLAVQAYDPRHAVALIDGPTELDGLPLKEIRHERALASLRLSSDDSWQASIEIPRLAAEALGKSDRLLAHARSAGATAAFALSADGLELALDTGALAIDRFEIVLTLPREALAHDPAKYLAETGKEASVTTLSARQGDLTITGSGAVTLDREGYLAGRVSTRISRVDLLLDNVKRVARLTDDEATAAKTFIELLQQGKGPGEPQVDLIAKDRKLYFGPFKIADLPPLR